MTTNPKVKKVYFFIGTEAELIKLFPVIVECRNAGMACSIVASGQNDLRRSRILKSVGFHGEFVELSREKNIRKSAVGLFRWFIAVERRASRVMAGRFGKEALRGAVLVVHGDTVSTMMGAIVGRKLGMCVCHVEAGLRSHNLLNPFPEEIDRLITSRLARVHFAPGDVPAGNLKRAKGRVVNTRQNTLMDSLRFSQDIPLVSDIADILSEDYFVCVMHRQENLASKVFVQAIVRQITEIAGRHKCVLILHQITKNALEKFGLMDELSADANIVLQPRMDYFDFMKLLKNAAFVITDGGSNQEELFYMNKPCLIIRRTTERGEGLGANARLYNGEASDLKTFVDEFESGVMAGKGVVEGRPSRVIAKVLGRIASRGSKETLS